MTVKLIWNGARHDLMAAETALTEVLFPPADAASLIKADPVSDDDQSEWSLHVYFEEPPNRANIDEAFASLGVSMDAPVAEDLPDIDWVAHALTGLGVVRAGDFLLYGRHDAHEAVTDGDLIPIQIDANRAFGTGHHPTTAGCLIALSRLRSQNPNAILDVGTGSGVLAIAARKLWPNAVIAGTDIDPPSVDIAEENAQLNDAPNITFLQAEGLGPALQHTGPAPLVMANILAEPLIALAPAIADALAPGGHIVLAGLLARQQDAVLEAYSAQGLCLSDTVQDDTWPVLILSHQKS